MPSAHTQIFNHIVFSTKQRAKFITPELEARLYPFISGIARDLRCQMIGINGMPDHIHVLVRIRADLSLSDLVRHIKARSSKWINETRSQVCRFQWQEGYGAFSVSTSAMPNVLAYIARQKEHHQRVDFQTEYLELLRRHGVEIDLDEVFHP